MAGVLARKPFTLRASVKPTPRQTFKFANSRYSYSPVFSLQSLKQRNFSTQVKQEQQLYKPAPAIEYIAEVPPKEVDGRNVWCDGGNGALGHPRVFINLDKGDPQSCGYCGLRFVQKHHGEHHH
eukprot:TRINITY_DN543_c0_g1_i5.p1 TRINITY_DN543_c0_g1~~TRINITY_DN543_c0_g1_i5.p1  ORF type:complete len:124 (-),score=19.37 TRINITY_DN543_c0_g1_i5:125-496(-)